MTKRCTWYLISGGVDWKVLVYSILSKVKIYFKYTNNSSPGWMKSHKSWFCSDVFIIKPLSDSWLGPPFISIWSTHTYSYIRVCIVFCLITWSRRTLWKAFQLYLWLYKKPPQMLVAYTLFKNLFYLESCNLSTVWWNLFISAPLSTAGETQKLEWAEVPLVHTNGGWRWEG